MIFRIAQSLAYKSAKCAIYPWAAYFLLPIMIWLIFSYSEVVQMITKMLWWGIVSGPVGYLLGEPLFHQRYVEQYWVPVNALSYVVVGVFWYVIFLSISFLLLSLAALNDALLKRSEKS
jgi:hypothetical protein